MGRQSSGGIPQMARGRLLPSSCPPANRSLPSCRIKNVYIRAQENWVFQFFLKEKNLMRNYASKEKIIDVAKTWQAVWGKVHGRGDGTPKGGVVWCLTSLSLKLLGSIVTHISLNRRCSKTGLLTSQGLSHHCTARQDLLGGHVKDSHKMVG